MSLLPYLMNELLEERERRYNPLQQLFDQNFGTGLFESDLFDHRPTRNRILSEPLLCGYLRPWRIRPLSQSGVSDVKVTKDGLKVNLDVQQFKPEEVSVKVSGNYLVVEGKHEERKDDHGFVSRSFVRRYQIPETIDESSISSSLSSDGVLQITAPSKALPPSSQERVVSITQTNKPAVKDSGDEKKEKKEK